MSRLEQLESELYSTADSMGVPVSTKVPISRRSIELVSNVYRWVRRKVSNCLERYGLMPSYERPLKITAIDPGKNGIVQGYTNGEEIGVNAYIIPENNFFYKLVKSAYSKNNVLAKYLRKIIDNPLKNLYKTIVHEELHNDTQIDTGFIDMLYKKTVEYLNKKLPEPLKKLSNYIASKVIVPMLEGLNEATTLQIVEGLEDNKEIEKRVNNPKTTYDAYTKISVNALKENGIRNPLDFYRMYIKDPAGSVWRYIRGFIENVSKVLSPQYATA